MPKSAALWSTKNHMLYTERYPKDTRAKAILCSPTAPDVAKRRTSVTEANQDENRYTRIPISRIRSFGYRGLGILRTTQGRGDIKAGTNSVAISIQGMPFGHHAMLLPKFVFPWSMGWCV
jgi:hypothetical protein